ncbi:hypothetical protein R69608_03248 [Paraburkholderia nemoris]|uniref:ATP-binding protein n=1 Tax=Paraburkholderia nemoris TaxID=2793076 RepID=UPI001911F60B|nr:winged helix-turn-helix domain-containing protein [Paraburkholderia nemoris]MBK5148572.1 winged helix-turn-helix domain-containing protein [Burkholderia sp. R-69608]CAE6906565.1 hypothetical protein R69608_03248 [Paraburkholderia nemoris]
MNIQFQTGVQLSFGQSTVIPGRRELLNDGKPVPVGDRAFDLLLSLIAQHGTVVSKDHMMETVWPRRIVGENTLEGHMSDLRRALGKDRDAIRTITGSGYQFVGELRQTSPFAIPLVREAEPGAVIRHIPCLPSHISPMVGRNAELSEVVALLQSQRLVTLVGPGGVGKTRLAVEAARAVSERFDNGVFLVELAAASSEASLSAAICTALGFPLANAIEDLVEFILALRGRRFLLVIDNCEHLVDDVVRLANALLHSVPSASVLATSREALRIAGEHVYRVPTLDVPGEDYASDAWSYSAIRLLRDRICPTLYGENDSDSLALIVRICRQLDGIPLAIELAAACTPAFGLQDLADRLDDRFSLLRYGARTALPRQQSLRAAVDWSYELLPQKWRTVLNRLGMFAGPFTLESAHQLVSSVEISSHEVTTAIIELVNKSLVCVLPEARPTQYRLLETIRIYARERLQESSSYCEWSARRARYIVNIFNDEEHFAAKCNRLQRNEIFRAYFEDLRAAFFGPIQLTESAGSQSSSP